MLLFLWIVNSFIFYQKLTKWIDCCLKNEKETTYWKKKKQLVRTIRGNSCMLKEAATASYSWKRDVPQFY